MLSPEEDLRGDKNHNLDRWLRINALRGLIVDLAAWVFLLLPCQTYWTEVRVAREIDTRYKRNVRDRNAKECNWSDFIYVMKQAKAC